VAETSCHLGSTVPRSTRRTKVSTAEKSWVGRACLGSSRHGWQPLSRHGPDCGPCPAATDRRFAPPPFFLVCAGGLAACGVTPTAQAVPPQAPSTTSVVRSRFAVSIDLDRKGACLVTPPPKRAAPTVTESDAEAMFEATECRERSYAFAIFGLGVVTVAARVENPTTTTTSPPPPSTGPTTTVPRPPPHLLQQPRRPQRRAPCLRPRPHPQAQRRVLFRSIVAGWLGRNRLGRPRRRVLVRPTTLPAPPSTTMYVAIVIDARTGPPGSGLHKRWLVSRAPVQPRVQL